jgi:CBS domain containing-hemolysin-like protein
VSPFVWLGIGLFIAGNAFFVAAEFGAVGVRRSRVRRMADDGSFLAGRLLPYVDDAARLDRYVGASQIGITLTSLVLGAFAQATVGVALAPVFSRAFALEPATAVSASAITVLVILTAVQVVIGELVPKQIALQYPTGTALATVLPMRWAMTAFRPFLALLNGSANGILRLLGIHATAHRHIHSPDEIELLIAESRDGGLLEADELDRLRKALRLRLRTARDLMVPRPQLLMISAESSWDDILRTAAASPFSRLPVYRGSPDDIVGILRVKDVVYRFVTNDSGAPLDRLLRPALKIRESLPADQIIAHLREHRAHQAIVIDAAGAVAGLVTVQDVLGAFLQTSATLVPRSPGAGGTPETRA